MREARAVRKSNESIKFARDMDVESGLTDNNRGIFIGKRGASNLRSLQKRTGTIVHESASKNWFVYCQTFHEGLVKKNIDVVTSDMSYQI